jgi:tetratricopeptide (TPR) repeat protein
MKIIFLDNDGVICLSNNWGSRYKKQRNVYIEENPRPFHKEIPVDLRFDNFDQKAIKALNRILTETGADIVVSSDWRLHANLEELGDYYEAQGILKRPIAVTPRIEEFDEETAELSRRKGWLERARCLEIQHWLSKNPVDSWVAVDDLNMSNEYLNPGLDHFILTSRSNEGIKQVGVANKIISILNETNNK